MKTEYLITGASGQLGAALMSLLGTDAVGTDLPEVDVTDPGSVRAAVDRYDPRWIINCAAVVDVDLCQRKPDLAFKVNSDGVKNLAMTGRKLLTISTDHVFTGFKGQKVPFLEGDKTSPANVYGESKLLGEAETLDADPGNIVIRTSWMFSSQKGMIPFFWKSLSEDGEVMAVCDQVACLTFAPDLAKAVIDIISRGGNGLYHITCGPGLTPAQIAEKLTEFTGGSVREVLWSDLDLDAPRPVYSEMATSRGIQLPGVWDAVERWRKNNV
ncbi:MAG: sugar nucleotide-binding protein [Candidatus Aegiribacteria sp.]|nr:sugar nucleotide-binding protein [Candidatus Aegiribacteria sp.]